MSRTCAQSETIIQITDRFWPYQRRCDPPPDEARQYVGAVKCMFLAPRCVQSSFTAADEKLVLSLHRRGIPLVQVERAILLGTARKYVSLLQHGRGTPISSLHYFTALFEEVHQEVSPQYWAYVARKVKAFEQTRAGFVTKATDVNEAVANGQNGGCYDSTDMPVVGS